ncbi:XamI family restriction endonuclease [Longimicrobium sp.]|uniref:XamI family restriction endonuclease n=1 Tax=Longimicrobium sp. TaxID=2029185 RepID=UPI002B55F5AA|nr:XamI family restriction endonuclease [Longimicrobium sp.]HSU15343.1 XamI family restriction endonuclease [Longimicrobium sp.]
MYSEVELDQQRRVAIDHFRRERLEEPLEDYLEHVDNYLGSFEDLLEATVDLTSIAPAALELLTDPEMLEAFRYLAGPPISTDDLKTVAEATSVTANRFRKDPGLVRRVVDVVQIALDRRRFPWVTEEREPTEAERQAAVLASAALMATRRMETARRHTGKGRQEQRVEDALLAGGWKKVAARTVKVISDAPEAGHFCRESMLGSRKADFIIRLWDQRVMPIECKVSNSATNSVKRLNNDAAAKAVSWRQDFGQTQIVPAAVLSGVYKLHNLLDAQARGLSLFWEHDLAKLVEWTESARR